MRNLLAATAATLSLALAMPTPALAKAPETAVFAPTRFSVEVIGNGPDVILIPGLATPREVWRTTAEALKAHYRVHLTQLKGFGEDAGPNALGPVLAPFVADLGRYIADNKLQHPAVIGHSLGGLAALMLAADHPDLPGRVMVVDALPFIGTLFDPAATPESLAPRAEMMRQMMLHRPPVAAQDCSALTGPGPLAPGVLSNTARGQCLIARWSGAADGRVAGQALVDDLAVDMRPRLAAIRAPLTVAYAQDDRVGPAAMFAGLFGGQYADAKQTKLVAISGSLHFTMLDQPAATLAAIESFLAD